MAWASGRADPLAYSGRGDSAVTIMTRRDTLLPDPEPPLWDPPEPDDVEAVLETDDVPSV